MSNSDKDFLIRIKTDFQGVGIDEAQQAAADLGVTAAEAADAATTAAERTTEALEDQAAEAAEGAAAAEAAADKIIAGQRDIAVAADQAAEECEGVAAAIEAAASRTVGITDRQRDQVAQVAAQYRRTGQAAREMGAATAQGGRNGAMALLELSRAVEDAQYGLRGILNNLPGLAMNLGAGAGLAGAISLVAVALSILGPKLIDLISSSDEAAAAARRHAAAEAQRKRQLELLATFASRAGREAAESLDKEQRVREQVLGVMQGQHEAQARLRQGVQEELQLYTQLAELRIQNDPTLSDDQKARRLAELRAGSEEERIRLQLEHATATAAEKQKELSAANENARIQAQRRLIAEQELQMLAGRLSAGDRAKLAGLEGAERDQAMADLARQEIERLKTVHASLSNDEGTGLGGALEAAIKKMDWVDNALVAKNEALGFRGVDVDAFTRAFWERGGITGQLGNGGEEPVQMASTLIDAYRDAMGLTGEGLERGDISDIVSTLRRGSELFGESAETFRRKLSDSGLIDAQRVIQGDQMRRGVEEQIQDQEGRITGAQEVLDQARQGEDAARMAATAAAEAARSASEALAQTEQRAGIERQVNAEGLERARQTAAAAVDQAAEANNEALENLTREIEQVGGAQHQAIQAATNSLQHIVSGLRGAGLDGLANALQAQSRQMDAGGTLAERNMMDMLLDHARRALAAQQEQMGRALAEMEARAAGSGQLEDQQRLAIAKLEAERRSRAGEVFDSLRGDLVQAVELMHSQQRGLDELRRKQSELEADQAELAQRRDQAQQPMQPTPPATAPAQRPPAQPADLPPPNVAQQLADQARSASAARQREVQELLQADRDRREVERQGMGEMIQQSRQGSKEAAALIQESLVVARENALAVQGLRQELADLRSIVRHNR